MSDDRAIVVLIGAPAAGKTRTGKRVAKALGVPFLDTDALVVAQHGPIADLFEQHGEPHFRALERAAVADALRQRAVVTLGGGAVLDPHTRADLAGLPVVQLTVRAEGVEDRIRDGKRPLLKGGIEAWQRLVDERRPLYDSLAGLTLDTTRVPLDRVAARILDWLEPA